MALEAGVVYIEDLVATNPDGAADFVDEGDDHIRNIKTAVKGSFPNLGAAAVTKTAAQLNASQVATVPATTNNLAMLDASGDLADSLVETDGAGNITANVTGNVTGASTVDVDTITADTLNGDLELTRNGTGGITVDSTPIYGLVYLNTPVQLITPDTSTTATGNTPVDLSAHASITGTAVKVILNVFMDIKGGGGTSSSEVLVGEGGETLTTLTHRAVSGKYASESASPSNQIVVNLATGEIFDYAILQTGTAPSTRTVNIYLAGYYI